MTSTNGVNFFKRVGIVAGALLAVIALSNTLGGIAVKSLVVPEIDRIIKEERMARENSEDKIMSAIGKLSNDRVRLLTIMEERNLRSRTLLLKQFRDELNKSKDDDPKLYGR